MLFNRRYVAPAALWLSLLIPPPRFGAGAAFLFKPEKGGHSPPATAADGDAIVFDANIALTSDLPSVSTSVFIDGAGHALSGNDQFRGLIVVQRIAFRQGFPPPVDVSIQNLTIANTVALGGNGGAGLQGGVEEPGSAARFSWVI